MLEPRPPGRVSGRLRAGEGRKYLGLRGGWLVYEQRPLGIWSVRGEVEEKKLRAKSGVGGVGLAP